MTNFTLWWCIHVYYSTVQYNTGAAHIEAAGCSTASTCSCYPSAELDAQHAICLFDGYSTSRLHTDREREGTMPVCQYVVSLPFALSDESYDDGSTRWE